MFKAICGAFALFSIIPIGKGDYYHNTNYIITALPLVGLVIGLVQLVVPGLLLSPYLPSLLTGAIITALPIIISGGIHVDGFCDTSDALASWGDQEKRRAILKDSHIGAFAVIHFGIYLLLYFALAVAFTEITTINVAILFCLTFTASRILGGLAIVCLPASKPEGLGHDMAQAVSKTRAKIILAIEGVLVATAMIIFGQWFISLVMLAAFALLFLYFRHMALTHFGGVSGDLAGWLIQISELVALAVIVLCLYLPHLPSTI